MRIVVNLIYASREPRKKLRMSKKGKKSVLDILTSDEGSELGLRVLELETKGNELLGNISTYQRENKIEYFTRPNPLQKQLLEAWLDTTYNVFTFTGANRIGKTTIGTVLINSTLFGKYLWDGTSLKAAHRKPRKIRYVGQDWDKHIRTVIIPALKEWWPKHRPLEVRKNNIGVEYLWTDLMTGSTLEVMSNKQDTGSFEGWEGDLVVYDEPPKREIRIACARGLIDRNGRELFCMTLIKEAWVHTDVIMARLDDGRPSPAIFNVSGEIWENVGYGLTKEGVESFISKCNQDDYNARIKGIPSYMSGIIYPMFKRATHLKPVLRKVPLDWVIDIAIDFHPSKEWAVLFLATDSRNFKYILCEIWEHGSWKAIGEKIVRTVKRWGTRVNNIIIDPLAKGTANADLESETVYTKLENLFYGYGYHLTTASKDKESGIQLVKDLLWTENQMPALFFMEDLRRTIKEIENWMYDTNGKPIKKLDDMMENLYRLVNLDTQYEPPYDSDDIVDINYTPSTSTGY